MVERNAGFANLSAGYLFPEVAKRRREYQAKHPDAKIISLGIGKQKFNHIKTNQNPANPWKINKKGPGQSARTPMRLQGLEPCTP